MCSASSERGGGIVLTVKHVGEDGSVLVRDNFVFALFMQKPLTEVAEGIRRAIDRWTRELPADTLAFGEIGASATQRKPLGPKGAARAIARLAGTGKGNLVAFSLQGPEEDNAAYLVQVCLEQELGRTSKGTVHSGLLEFRFPSDHFARGGTAAMIELVTEIASYLPYDSGYFAPAVSWSYESDLRLARRIIGPLGLRHPGLDISFNASSCYKIDRRCRGPYWLTLVGGPALRVLGGKAVLRQSLPSGVEVREIGDGVLLVAGEAPDPGDRNRDQRLPLLRGVAASLEPVTFFDDKAIQTYLFGDDEEKFAMWDRRLLD